MPRQKTESVLSRFDRAVGEGMERIAGAGLPVATAALLGSALALPFSTMMLPGTSTGPSLSQIQLLPFCHGGILWLGPMRLLLGGLATSPIVTIAGSVLWFCMSSFLGSYFFEYHRTVSMCLAVMIGFANTYFGLALMLSNVGV